MQHLSQDRVLQGGASHSAAGKPERDARIDVLRGLALLMIFVDHMPDDLVNRVTLHNYGFCDAAEVFVLLAGFSSMLAFGRAFDRDGPTRGLRRVAARCGRIYLVHAALLLATLLVVQGWTMHYHMPAKAVAPILGHPVKGLVHGLTLSALPDYLDILPLYVVLLAIFPLIYAGVRRSPVAALIVSAGVWLAASLDHSINLPNWLNANGWYFDPFSWQFMFVIGAVLCGIVTRAGGVLPRNRWAVCGCAAFLAFAFVEAAPYHDWGLPNLQLIAMDMPDKSRLNFLRIVDVLALFYLLLSSPRIRLLTKSVWLRPIEACGRHSLEVFALGCMLALFGRLIFRVEGETWLTEIGVNVGGFALMCGAGLWLDQARQAASVRASQRRPALVPVGRA